jgi:hypothetical protein
MADVRADDGFRKEQDEESGNRQCNQVGHRSGGEEPRSFKSKGLLRSRSLHLRATDRRAFDPN